MSAPQEVVEEQAAGGSEPLSALAALMSLEARPLPSSLTLSSVNPSQSSASFCFDVAGWPRGCGWKAKRMCRRSEALFDVCQGEWAHVGL